MNKFFSKNVPWKIISLFLAMLLWIFVINTQNPILPKEIKAKGINIKGINELEAKGFVLQNEEELRDLEVKVVVRGPRLEMEKLMSDAKSLDVYIDLKPYANTLTEEDAESIEKPVSIVVSTGLEGIKIEEIKPQTVSVIFEKEKVVVKNIQHNIKGATNSEYMTLEPVLNPRTVEMSGPKSAVDRVHKAVVDINVDDFSENALTYTVPIRLLDKEGNEVYGVRKSPEHIQVTLPIGKKKKVAIKAQFKGTLPQGYIQTNTLVTPQEVTIVGDPTVIDQITEIKLEPISLNNMIQSGTFNVNLLLPENVTPIDKIEGKAIVTVEIQKESFYEYKVNTQKIKLHTIGLQENQELSVIPSEVTIVLSGTAEDLLKITGENIEATIDFTTLGEITEGTYSVPVSFKIPETLKVLSAPATLQVEVKNLEPVFQPEDEDLEEENTHEGT